MRRLSLVTLAIAVALSLFSVMPTAAAAAIPDITVSPTALDFGSVTVGQTSVNFSVTVRNDGQSGSLLTLGAPQVAGSPADFPIDTAASTCGPAPHLLAAGESCLLWVQFAPTTSGARSATMTIPNDDPDESQSVVSLAGTGLTAAQPSISPAAHSFGSSTVGTTSATHSFTVSNTGQTPYVASGAIVGASAADFVLAGGTCAWPDVSVPANDDCTVEVHFTPTAAGARSATLTVGSASATLSGEGIAAPDVTSPSVTITRLAIRHQRRKATAFFTGRDDVTPVSGLRYVCKVDTRQKRACTSPKVFERLKPGRHVIRVRAVDRAGNVSAPAVKRFRVRR